MPRRPFNYFDEEDTVAERQSINEAVDELRQLLPVSAAVLANMDRQTVVKAATGYLYLRQLPWPVGSGETTLCNSTVLQAMDHFCMILDGNANIIYTTENISTTFGFSQCQLFGASLYEIIHPMDRSLIEILVHGATELEHTSQLTLRFKTKQSKRTVGFAIEENGQKYKVAVIQVYMTKGTKGVSLMASGTVLDKNGFPDLPLHSSQCVFYTSMDLKIVHVTGMESFLGKPWISYTKISLYLLVHPEDAHHVCVAHIPARDHRDYEMETLCVRLLCDDDSFAYVTMYFLYRQAMVNVGEDTIKIIVTYFGKRHPNLPELSALPVPETPGPSTSHDSY